MTFELKPLPYDPAALEPHMSARTLEFHHGKHHKAYVDNLNKMIVGSPFEKASLEDIIRDSYEDTKSQGIFNNAAQVWNHDFFWNSMKPNGGGAPTGNVLKMINDAFGDLDGFKTKFKEAATTQFGSGWAWLIADGSKLAITKTPNGVDPLAQGQKALVTCDVWEHAYYLDYQNRRPDMVQTFLDKLINWDFVAKNLGA
jgi:Fe-Mn family superoxide dismutase